MHWLSKKKKGLTSIHVINRFTLEKDDIHIVQNKKNPNNYTIVIVVHQNLISVFNIPQLNQMVRPHPKA